MRTIEDDVDIYLSKLWNLITIERPHNHHDIVKFCVKDIEDSADRDNWTTEDIEIAFRRYLESKKPDL